MEKKIDKAEFVRRVSSQFHGIYNHVPRNFRKEVEGREKLMDSPSFFEWLKEERERLLNDPSLRVFHLVLSNSMNTPEEAAQTLANFIEFDSKASEYFGIQSQLVNWSKAWEMAAPVLSGIKPERSENWKFTHNFSVYIKALTAARKIEVLTEYIEAKSTKPEKKTKKQKSKQIDARLFLELFAGDTEEQQQTNCDWALRAAKEVDPPLINPNNRLLPNYLKLPGIRAFYDACFDADILSSEFRILEAMNLISIKFTLEGVGRNAKQTKADSKLKGKLTTKLTDLKKGV